MPVRVTDLANTQQPTAVSNAGPVAVPNPTATPSLAVGLGPVSQGVEQANATHSGARSAVVDLRSSGSQVALASAQEAAAAARTAAEIAQAHRTELMQDPEVRAALKQVPGMKSLKLEKLTAKDIKIGALDGAETVKALREGKYTCVEVVQSAIDRTKAGRHLGPVDHELFDQALNQAAEADRKQDFSKPFAGVPIMVKANAKLKGAPTSYGSRTGPTTPAEKNAPHIDDLLALGFIPIAMSKSSEFGFNGSTEPVGDDPVRNPLNPEHTAGGSSGGSACAVASGMVPVAHGTDGGGSLRIPAAVTGIKALKAGLHRFTKLDGAENLPVIINTPGVIVRSMKDMATSLFHLDRGTNEDLPAIGSIRGMQAGPQQNLRIKYYVDPVGGRAEPHTRQALKEFTDLLRSLGHTVEETKPPYTQQFVDDFLLLYRGIAHGARTKLEDSPVHDADKLEPFSKGLADLTWIERKVKLPLAVVRLKTIHKMRYNRFFKNCDVLVNPTVAGDAPKLGELDPAQSYDQMIDALMDFVAYTPLQNGTGGPALSLPFGESDLGLPNGMQLAAGMGQEELLVRLGVQIEEAMAER